MIDEIKKIAECERDYIVSLRRDFHAHPELALHEFRTAEIIERELESFGIEHKRVGETGVLGILKGNSKVHGKHDVVLLRADIDALPINECNKCDYVSQNAGVMHACGHDAHTACLLGAAKILSKLRDNFSGEVRFVFQQAEEIGAGAKIFLADESIMQGTERVFGLHTAPDLKSGSVGIKAGQNNAAVDYFKIEIKGKSSHVSTPHLGIDALYIASHIVVAVQSIVTRLSTPIEPLLIGIGKLSAGTAYNAIAEYAVLEGTTRTLSEEARKKTKNHINEIAQNIAALYGGEATLEWKDFTSSLSNDKAICQEVSAVAEKIFGAENIVYDRTVSLGGDDMAEFLLKAPGAYAYLGTRNDKKPETQNSAHTVNFNIDEDVLPLGSALYASAAVDWLSE